MEDYSLLKIYSDKVVRYTPIFHKKISEKQLIKAKENFNKEKLTGVLSLATKSYIRQRLDVWLNCMLMANRLRKFDSKGNLRLPVFLTVTLSDKQKHSDNDIKRNLLGVLIEKLKYHYDIKNIFWRAEAQDNENIHFHLITDTYIDKFHLQKMWNDIQETHGYIENFYKKYGHRNPPSTHIKAVKDVQDFVRYCIKYATKDDDRRPINGRMWGMTDSLRNFTTLTYDLDTSIWRDIEKLLSEKKMNELHTDHFSVYYSKVKFTDRRNSPAIFEVLCDHYLKLFKNFYVDENVSLPTAKDDVSQLSDFSEQLTEAFNILQSDKHNNQLSLFESDVSIFSQDFTSIHYFH